MDKIHVSNTLPKVFQGRTDLNSDVWLKTLDFEKGKTYLVQADSGTGKSSLLSYIYGYRKDYEGTFFFDDTDIRKLKKWQWTNLRQSHLALLWQDLRLFPELTAMENVMIKNKLTNFQTVNNIHQWFEWLGIADKKNALIGKMSFGQQQRVALIRTLCQPFDFIFLDEPISHLDDNNAGIMAAILMKEANRQGAGVIITSIGKHMNIPYHYQLKL